jgi:hypothetical protein
MRKITFQKIFNALFRKNKRIDYGDGLYPPDNFTGIWEVYWPNGRLKWRSFYKNGKAEGEHLCLLDNGVIAQNGQNINGECVGDWFDYWEDGQLFKRTVYKDAKNFNVFWYDNTGKVSKLGASKRVKSTEFKFGICRRDPSEMTNPTGGGLSRVVY